MHSILAGKVAVLIRNLPLQNPRAPIRRHPVLSCTEKPCLQHPVPSRRIEPKADDRSNFVTPRTSRYSSPPPEDVRAACFKKLRARNADHTFARVPVLSEMAASSRTSSFATTSPTRTGKASASPPCSFIRSLFSVSPERLLEEHGSLFAGPIARLNVEKRLKPLQNFMDEWDNEVDANMFSVRHAASHGD